jgi:hypothetical protein
MNFVPTTTAADARVCVLSFRSSSQPSAQNSCFVLQVIGHQHMIQPVRSL